MLNFDDFQEIFSIQVTLFITGFSFTTSQVLKALIGLGGDLLDGDPTVLPLPPDAPSEIPRILFKDKKGSMKIEISPVRVNFFRNKLSEDDSIVANEFILMASDFLKKFTGSIGAKCGRMATVLKRVAFKDKPGREIASHFCKEEFLAAPFDRPTGFELHAHKQYEFQSIPVNSWVRIKAGQVGTTSGLPHSTVFAEQDINTLAELMDSRAFSGQEQSRFFEGVYEELNRILKLYFPDQRHEGRS